MTALTKNLALTVGIMTIGSAAAWARQAPAPPTPRTAPTNTAVPKIQFATPVFDFGRAKAGEPVTHDYVFTNTGDGLLIINAVQPGCGCTTAGEWTKQVEPDKTGTIPIRFNTAAYNGTVIKTISVTCNITNRPPMVALQLKGTVYKPYEFNPPFPVLNVPPDAETASMIVTITNHTEEPLMLSSPQSNNRVVSAELETNTPGRGYRLKVLVAPPLPSGSVQAMVNLRSSWTNTPVVTVPVLVNIQPAIMVIPTYLTLAAGPLANAVTNSVTIRNQSTNSLVLSDPAINVPGAAVEIKELQPGRSFAAMVAFPPGCQLPLGRQAEVTIKSSNPKYPVVKVPVLQMPHPAQPRVPVATPTAPPKPATASSGPVRPIAVGHPNGLIMPPRPKTPPKPPPLPPGL
jgi:hypothetical protein